MRIAAVCDELAPSIIAADKLAHELGLSGIILRMSGVRRFPDFSVSDAEYIRRGLLKTNLLGASPGLWKNDWNDDHSLVEWETEAARARQSALIYGITSLSYFTGKARNQEHLRDPERLSDKMPDGIVKTLQCIVQENVNNGIGVLLENNYATWAATGRSAGELAGLLHSNNVKLIWDPASSAATRFDAGLNLKSLMPIMLDEWDEIKSMVAEIHVRGFRIRTGQRSWCIPELGALDWNRILQWVCAYNPSILLTIEHHQFKRRESASRASLKFIQEALADFDYTKKA